jgi:hypothetical protein
MPGIADLVPAQIQASSVGAVTNPNVDISSLGKVPEFDDFMNAYKQGVITAEDIKKRQIVGTTGYEAEKAKNLEAKAGAEQGLADLTEVRPMQRELVKTQTAGAQQQATLANALGSNDPAIRIPAEEAFVKRARQKEAILLWGTATPRLYVNQEITPASFEDWTQQQVNAYRPGDNSEIANQKRAEYQRQIEASGPEKTPEYKLYVKEAKGRTMELKPGTPEYDAELRHQLSEHLKHEQLQQIQFEVYKEFQKANITADAKVRAEGTPTSEHVVKEFNAATGKEEQTVVRTDKRTGEVVSKTKVGETAPTITENQGKSASFAAQMKQSEAIFDGISQDRQDPNTGEKIDKFDPSSWTSTAQGFLPNRLRTDDAQLYNTAKKNWITAVLRQQSGAAIAKHEFDRYESQFFPQDGDTKEVMQQKKLLRDEQTKLMQLQAGPAAPALGPSSPNTTPPVKTAARPTVEQASAAPTYKSLAEVPSNVQFFKTVGSPQSPSRVLINPNYRP